MKYTAKQIEEISHGEPTEIASFITNLLLYIEKLEIQIDHMKELLQEACHHKKKWRLEDIPIKEADALEWEKRYDRILERGE